MRARPGFPTQLRKSELLPTQGPSPFPTSVAALSTLTRRDFSVPLPLVPSFPKAGNWPGALSYPLPQEPWGIWGGMNACQGKWSLVGELEVAGEALAGHFMHVGCTYGPSGLVCVCPLLQI